MVSTARQGKSLAEIQRALLIDFCPHIVRILSANRGQKQPVPAKTTDPIC